VDLEKSVLAQLTETEEMRRAWDLGLRSVHICDPLNGSVFRFIESYWQDTHLRATPSREAVSYEFPRFAFPEQVEESTTWLVQKLKERHLRNTINKTILDAAERAGNGEVHEALRGLQHESWQAMKQSLPRAGRVNFAENVEQRRERYRSRAEFQGEVAGVPFGLDAVDQHTFGILDGELATIVGFAKSGKSMMLCRAAVAARRAGYTPYFATLELSSQDMQDRLDAHHAGVPYEAIQKGRLTVEQALALHQAQDEFAALGPLHVEKLSRGERTPQYIVNRARDVGANFLIIDQLSFLESNASYRENHQKVADIVSDLKQEISEDETSLMPTLLAAQMNREGNKAGKVELHHIALSSAVEQTVDIAYSISQTAEQRANHCMRLGTLGFRRGVPKNWLLDWRFTDMTRIDVRMELEDE
jgi:replicative DNA helicase